MVSVRTKLRTVRAVNEAIRYPHTTGDSPNKEALKERNDQLYEMLSRNKLCVLPDPRIRAIDMLPQFEIVDSVHATHIDEYRRQKQLRKEVAMRV
jgi:hypothetical protein